MHIQSRLSILIITVALSSLCTSTLLARGPQKHHPEGPRHEKPRDIKVNPAPTPEQPNVEGRLEGVPENRPAIRAKRHQRCRNKARRGIPGGCYLVDDEWVEDVTSEGGDTPPAARQGSSSTIPTPRVSKSTSGDPQVISPVGDEALKNELIAARRNWIAKKKLADDVSAAHARAEYQASQNGTKVDPALTERQRLAREEAAQAHQAMQPVVERARKAGFAPKTLELYEQNSQGY
jgi:hypothetical protein